MDGHTIHWLTYLTLRGNMITVGDKVIFVGENWGNLVRVIGTVVEDHGNSVVIQDQDSETNDDRLEFKKSEVKLVEEVEHDSTL